MDGFVSPAARCSPLLVALAASLLHWLAQPPVGWWLGAWLVPVGWASLVQLPKLPGRRPYGMLWLAGVVYWLLAIYWVCLPHPLTSLGWLALSAYLGVYLPLFVALARVATRWCPLNLSCAVVGTGLELVQAHLFSGFHMAALGHTQLGWHALIQIADLGGAYLVSGVVIFVGASLYQAWQRTGWKQRGLPLASAAVLLAMAQLYGQWRSEVEASSAKLHVAVVQGAVDMRVVSSREEYNVVREATNREYFELTAQAIRQHPTADVVIWPETMVTESLVSADDNVRVIDGREVTRDELDLMTLTQRAKITSIATRFAKPMLLGIDTWHYTAARPLRYNSALLVDRDGTLGPRYDKMHPVMFGEYIPLASVVPILYELTPLTGGIESGISAVAVPIQNAAGDSFTLCPSICYESVLSHVVRRQLTQLRARNVEPDVLVNLTNDGWFRGSAELDMHLACGIFRAIECRKPLVIAANTGISAVIDGNGRIVTRADKRQSTVLSAAIERDSRRSLYGDWGDLPAGACLAVCLVLAGLGLRRPNAPRHST